MTLRQLLRYPETRCRQLCGCVLIELFLQKLADGIWPTGPSLLTPDLYLHVVGDYIDLCKKVSELYSYNWVFYWMLIMSLLKKESKKSMKRLSQRGVGREEKKIVPQTSGRMLMEWTRVRNPEFIRTFALGCYEGPCVPSHLSLTLPWCEPARGGCLFIATKKIFQNTLPALPWPRMTSRLDLTRQVPGVWITCSRSQSSPTDMPSTRCTPKSLRRPWNLSSPSSLRQVWVSCVS